MQTIKKKYKEKTASALPYKKRHKIRINKESLSAAIQGSRRLAHFSTTGNAGGLIFCVRYGYRSCPAAMAAKRPSL